MKLFRKLFCVLLVCLTLSGCNRPLSQGEVDSVPESTPEPVPSQETETDAPENNLPVVEFDPEDLRFSAPYGDLAFPGEWEEFLRVDMTQGLPLEVTFQAVLKNREPVVLFTLIFGDNSRTPLGYIATAEGTTLAVRVDNPDFTPDETWSESEINIVFSMKEELNHVLAYLPLVNAPEDGDSSGEGDTQDTLAIDTPYGELYYPLHWLENLSIDIQEDPYQVTFCALVGDHPAMALFTVYFGGEQGVEAGSMGGTTLRIAYSQLERPEGWTDTQWRTVVAMQEDLNFLLNNLD